MVEILNDLTNNSAENTMTCFEKLRKSRENLPETAVKET
jgi:hypothetical protein